MLNKKIVLNILCSKQPFELMIMSLKGKVLLKSLIKSKNLKVCFYTKENCIKIKASYNNTTINQNISLKKVRCQNIFVSYGFNSAFSQITKNQITLCDANYGFPIKKALLNFKKFPKIKKFNQKIASPLQ